MAIGNATAGAPPQPLPAAGLAKKQNIVRKPVPVVTTVTPATPACGHASESNTCYGCRSPHPSGCWPAAISPVSPKPFKWQPTMADDLLASYRGEIVAPVVMEDSMYAIPTATTNVSKLMAQQLQEMHEEVGFFIGSGKQEIQLRLSTAEGPYPTRKSFDAHDDLAAEQMACIKIKDTQLPKGTEGRQLEPKRGMCSDENRPWKTNAEELLQLAKEDNFEFQKLVANPSQDALVDQLARGNRTNDTASKCSRKAAARSTSGRRKKPHSTKNTVSRPRNVATGSESRTYPVQRGQRVHDRRVLRALNTGRVASSREQVSAKRGGSTMGADSIATLIEQLRSNLFQTKPHSEAPQLRPFLLSSAKPPTVPTTSSIKTKGTITVYRDDISGEHDPIAQDFCINKPIDTFADDTNISPLPAPRPALVSKFKERFSAHVPHRSFGPILREIDLEAQRSAPVVPSRAGRMYVSASAGRVGQKHRDQRSRPRRTLQKQRMTRTTSDSCSGAMVFKAVLILLGIGAIAGIVAIVVIVTFTKGNGKGTSAV